MKEIIERLIKAEEEVTAHKVILRIIKDKIEKIQCIDNIDRIRDIAYDSYEIIDSLDK